MRVGFFEEQRTKLDYTYHRHYIPERQLLQDQVMRKFLRTRIVDGDVVCSKPTQPWIVFTVTTPKRSAQVRSAPNRVLIAVLDFIHRLDLWGRASRTP